MEVTTLNNRRTVTGIMNLTPGYWQRPNGDFYLVSGDIQNCGFNGSVLWNIMVISGSSFYPVEYNPVLDKTEFTFISNSIRLDF